MSMNGSLYKLDNNSKKKAKKNPKWGDEQWQRDMDEFGGYGYDMVADIEQELEKKAQKNKENKQTVYYHSILINRVDEQIRWALENKIPVWWLEVSPDIKAALRLSMGFVPGQIGDDHYHGYLVVLCKDGSQTNLIRLHLQDEDPPGFHRQQQASMYDET